MAERKFLKNPFVAVILRVDIDSRSTMVLAGRHFDWKYQVAPSGKGFWPHLRPWGITTLLDATATNDWDLFTSVFAQDSFFGNDFGIAALAGKEHFHDDRRRKESTKFIFGLRKIATTRTSKFR